MFLSRSRQPRYWWARFGKVHSWVRHVSTHTTWTGLDWDLWVGQHGGIVLFYASGLCRSSFLTEAHQQMFNWSTTVIDLWHLSAFIFCEMHEGMYTFSIIIQMCLCAVQSSCSGGERGKRRGAYGYRCERHRPERQQTYFCEWHFPGRSGRGLAKKYFIPSI